MLYCVLSPLFESAWAGVIVGNKPGKMNTRIMLTCQVCCQVCMVEVMAFCSMVGFSEKFHWSLQLSMFGLLFAFQKIQSGAPGAPV